MPASHACTCQILLAVSISQPLGAGAAVGSPRPQLRLPAAQPSPCSPWTGTPNCTPTPPQPSPACCQGRPPPAQTPQASREQPLAMHGGTLSIGAPSRAAPGWPHSPNPALPFPITPSSLCRAGAPLPGSLCTRRGHGAELLARRAQPAGHGAQQVPHSPQLPGHCGGRAAKAAAQSPPLHRDARSSAARLLASCTCRYVPAPPSPQLGQPNPWPRCQGYQSLLLRCSPSAMSTHALQFQVPQTYSWLP